MEVNAFHIPDELSPGKLVDVALCFKPFIDDVKHRSETETTIKAEFYRFVLNKLNHYPELLQTITSEKAANYPDVLELIYAVLSPTPADENEYYWAIGTPIPGDVIYSTAAFKKFLSVYSRDQNTILNQGAAAYTKRIRQFIYRLILKTVYHISSDVDIDNIYIDKDEVSGLEKFYKIHVDNCYTHIKPKKDLPELKPELIERFLHENAGPEIFDDILPLSLFRIEGFSIITIEDVTAAQSIENIRLALVNESTDQNQLFEQVTHSLQTLTGNSFIEFGLLPFLKVNDKLVYDTEECSTSVLIKTSMEQGNAEETYRSLTETYLKNPRAIFFNEISDAKTERYPYLKALRQAGICSYAILPVYYNRKLAGVMEIYSRKAVIYYEKLLSKLESAVPLLSQLLHNSSEQFKQRVEDVIKEKFTTLQHSVEWKFKEAAWNYIRQNKDYTERDDVKSVAFKEVYPMYGAVDIRNSTMERNNAIQHDLIFLLEKLAEILHKAAELKTETVRLAQKCQAWLVRIRKGVSANDEVHVKTFLESRVYSELHKLEHRAPELKKMIDAYFEAENEIEGEGYVKRRGLEKSISLINTALNNFFGKAQQKLQQIFPCYFEKFRTDGVEYDIYTGQSLAPDQPFDTEKLSEFRRWQLRSMIEIVHMTAKLLNVMECKLQTTQLIFIHANPIDICFRKDERRFDVEGAYNIRYEVIKKRIDKVEIKGTGERLTQPGRIALVYSTADEAEEYLRYIKECQEEKLLEPEIEHLELEELQGISGLKAIRVKVANEVK